MAAKILIAHPNKSYMGSVPDSAFSVTYKYNLIGIVEPARAITVHVTWHMNTHGNI